MNTSKIENIIGDIHKIDVSYTLEGDVYLVLVCAGYLDGSPEIQKALLDKMEGYLEHIPKAIGSNTNMQAWKPLWS